MSFRREMVLLSALVGLAIALPATRADAHPRHAAPPWVSVWFDARPSLVVVAPGFRVVADFDQEVFVYGGWWWTRYDGVWFRAADWDGPWVEVRWGFVPAYLRGVPYGYYRHYRPRYTWGGRPAFRDHWGHYHRAHRWSRPAYRLSRRQPWGRVTPHHRRAWDRDDVRRRESRRDRRWDARRRPEHRRSWDADRGRGREGYRRDRRSGRGGTWTAPRGRGSRVDRARQAPRSRTRAEHRRSDRASRGSVRAEHRRSDRASRGSVRAEHRRSDRASRGRVRAERRSGGAAHGRAQGRTRSHGRGHGRR